MTDNQDFMAWNAPGQNNDGGRGDRPQSGSDPQRNNDSGQQNNNPYGWGRNTGSQRQNSNGSGFDFSSVLAQLKKFLGGNGGGNGGNQSGFGKKAAKGGSYFLTACVAVCLGIYIFSGFYTVREAERGVVLRFGKVHEVVEPGLRWKFTGIDSVNIVDIEQVRAIQSSGSMLTEDENVVLVEMDVQYRISDPVRYLYSVTDPDNSLTEATDSALRYVVGHTMMDDILTSGREMVRQNTRDLLVSIIEPYNMGLSVVDVNFLPARAPDQVKAAFDDAIAAQEDEQRYKREAEAYANEVLPRADGQVQRILQEAEAYRTQVVLNAEGEVARFEQILPEYNAAPEITRTRIYLETMQEVYGKSQKIIVDTPEGNSPVLYMPVPSAPVQPQAPAAAAAPAPAASAPAVQADSQAQSQTGSSAARTAPAPLTRRDNMGYGSDTYSRSIR